MLANCSDAHVAQPRLWQRLWKGDAQRGEATLDSIGEPEFDVPTEWPQGQVLAVVAVVAEHRPHDQHELRHTLP